MKAEKLLPVVMLSLSTLHSPGVSATIVAASGPSGAATETNLPAVLRFQRSYVDHVKSERLDDFVHRLIRNISTSENIQLAQRPWDPCETISGSGYGWDDSDC